MVWYGMVWYGMVWYGMVSDCDTESVRSSGRWPYSVCKNGVGSNSSFVFSASVGA